LSFESFLHPVATLQGSNSLNKEHSHHGCSYLIKKKQERGSTKKRKNEMEKKKEKKKKKKKKKKGKKKRKKKKKKEREKGKKEKEREKTKEKKRSQTLGTSCRLQEMAWRLPLGLCHGVGQWKMWSSVGAMLQH